MKILYYNNTWFTNIGEAFIDIGAMQLLQEIFPGCRLINVSNQNRGYTEMVCKREKKENPYEQDMETFRMFEYYSGDYFVMSGMFISDEFLKTPWSNEIIELAKRGVKVILLGMGQALYSKEETENFKRYIDKIQPELFVSRDDVTYENFRDCCPAMKGLDCAFWIKDVYDPRGAADKIYNVVTYNRSPEPEELRQIDNVVRAYHMGWYLKPKHLKDNLLISDIPYDYLTLYANAHRVYTDLVHASIAALQYERHVRFERVDKRGYAIDALEKTHTDKEGFLYISEKDLEMQKQNIVKEAKNILYK